MKKIIILGSVLLSFALKAQLGKVGINHTAPTEVLDVNGTLRIREMQIDGTTNALYNGSATKSTTFTATNVMMTDANGNLGKALNKDLIPNKNYTGFNALDNSTAIFVTRQYTVSDWPSGQNSGAGFDTGMSTTKWEAILSNISYQLSDRYTTNGSTAANNPFINTFLTSVFGSEGTATTVQTFGWALGKNSGTWRIIGDFNSIQEQPTKIDIIFINKKYVATDRP
ncbi:hypothetical protein [Chryseobacterium taklimakanense]|uniref:hypothetical protein n=1 Tax=Chryseobacterium taklimakanense TaxID=536441 RepID=UPI0023F9753B|nr:hypothetical protein [Chryseobacterium taklimakanense]